MFMKNNPVNIVKIFCIFLCLALLGGILPSISVPAEEKVIAVLISRPIRPYNDALAGFKEGLGSSKYKPVYEEFNFKKFEKNTQELTSSIKELKPDLIYTIGSEASLFAKKNLLNTPVVFSMVLDPAGNNLVRSLDRPGGNITGVALDISIVDQFREFKKAVPGITRIGMLYDARTKTAMEARARRAAKQAGLRLLSHAVRSEKDISAKLDQVLAEADCLWAGIDPLIYNKITLDHIILATLKNKIPFMAFSSPSVKAGALLALECDYYDIGNQSADIVMEVFKGQDPGSISVGLPRTTRLAINQRTAQIIGVNIPVGILRKATVYGTK
jgi:putative ABC transport system substrate-binding protein